MKIRGPEAGINTCHDWVLCRHDIVDLARFVTVVAAVGRPKVTSWELSIFTCQLKILGEIKKMGVVPPKQALKILDRIWDEIYNFED